MTTYRNVARVLLRGGGRKHRAGDQHVRLLAQQLGGQVRQTLQATLIPAHAQAEVSAFDIAVLLEACTQRREPLAQGALRAVNEDRNAVSALRDPRAQPRASNARRQTDDRLAPVHSSPLAFEQALVQSCELERVA